jgi:hypothetical protein
MNESTLDLLTRRLYFRDIDDTHAINELSRRGWKLPFRVLTLAVILILIFPERLICGLGGDEWDDGPTRWRDLIFSVAFSLLVVMPVVVAWEFYQFLFLSDNFSIVSTAILLVAYIYVSRNYKERT